MNNSNPNIEKFFCNRCQQKTRHSVRCEHEIEHWDEETGEGYKFRMVIVECCGCESLAFVKTIQQLVDYSNHEADGIIPDWYVREEEIYPPVSYRSKPSWFEDLPDETMRQISSEIYKSLQSESLYLAAFGSRTLIDRLIFLTVGDQGSFKKGLKKLEEKGMISVHERDILKPVIEAGNAAAHRGWPPNKDQIATILDTVEGLVHRLLVLPKQAEELEDAVPKRGQSSTTTPAASSIPTITDKINTAPPDVREIYDALSAHFKALGNDVKIHTQKHYIAYRRSQNFASVQVYNKKKIIRVYLNIDPDTVELDEGTMRDMRQIGHYGTGDLEVILSKVSDIGRFANLF